MPACGRYGRSQRATPNALLCRPATFEQEGKGSARSRRRSGNRCGPQTVRHGSAPAHSGPAVFEFIRNRLAVATRDAQPIARDPSRDAAEPEEFPDPQRKSDHRGRNRRRAREKAEGVCARHKEVLLLDCRSANFASRDPDRPGEIDAHRARRNDDAKYRNPHPSSITIMIRRELSMGASLSVELIAPARGRSASDTSWA